MNSNSQPDVTALTDQRRARAKDLMAKAEGARRPAEIVRLTAIASTLEWAAGDLPWFAKCPHMASVLMAASDDSAGNTDG